MAWSVVTGASLAVQASGTGTSFSLGTLGAAVSIGDVIILHLTQETHAADTGGVTNVVTSVTDSLGNTYVKDHEQVYGDAANADEVDQIWRSIVTVAGTPIISCARASSTAPNVRFFNCVAQAFRGLAQSGTSADIDVSLFVGDTSLAAVTLLDSGTSGATGGANELVIGYGRDDGETTTLTADAAYTQVGKIDANSHAQSLLQYKDSGASGSTARSTVSDSFSGGWWGAGVIVYKLPSAGGGGTPKGGSLLLMGVGF